jgi:hypothetical protein
MKFIKKLIILSLVSLSGMAMAAENEFRPPSVPLVVHTPYFSVWSPGDWLTDTNTESWTGTPQPLDSLIRIDGRAYRLMGIEPANMPALRQISTEVLPTRTIAVFTNEKVQVTMTFMTPALLDDLDVLSRPVTYLTWQVRSTDGGTHAVQLYFGASTLLTVNYPDEPVSWNDASASGLKILRAGSVKQPVLQTYGDEIRVDWGYFYLGAPADEVAQAGFGRESTAPESFARGVNLPTAESTPSEAPDGDAPVLALTLDLGKVGAEPVRRHVMLAYDEVEAVRYFTKDLEPYWKRNGMTAVELLKQAELDYPGFVKRCEKFDAELMRDMKQAGGDEYATLGALAYRQTLGMHDLAADSEGNPLLFSKEPSSSGNIDTVDVIYPSSPLFMLFNPGLLRAMLVPILDYCNGPIIKHDSCPHDLGIYPQATGCWNGDAEIEIMPVEETADMLIMLAAVAHIEGNAELANHYWPLLSRWAGYLKRKGWDLDLQLCTDDFTGHLARNVNLSMKSIQAMGAYAELAGMLGNQKEAAAWRETAKEFASNLLKAADDGDHTMLALGHPGTWSQKYNLVWDKVLGLQLFPDKVRQREVAWYKKVMNPYGVPLDSRATFTKLDWSVWSASLSGNRQDFEILIAPIYRLLNESPQRVPMGDLLETTIPKWRGFKARPVVGGVFIQMLYNQSLWKKWAGRAPVIPNNWAPFPMPVSPDTVLEDSQLRPREWYYTTRNPGTNWTHVELDYKVWIGRQPGWRSTRGGFGSVVDESAGIRTHWDGDELWLRKPFVIRERDQKNLTLHVCHAGPIEIYFNEVLAAKLIGSSHGKFESAAVNPNAMAVLQPSDTLNTLAVHCRKAETQPMFDLEITCEK